MIAVNRIEDFTIGGLALTVALFIAAGLAGFVVAVRADAICLAHGYPKTQIDFRGNAYCIKRVDQTDVVVPLKEIAK